MTDNIQVRDVIDKETLSRVKSVGDTYKYGFSTDIQFINDFRELRTWQV